MWKVKRVEPIYTTRFPRPRDSSAPKTMAALTDNGRLVATPFLRGSMTRPLNNV